ncbi:proline-rich extensin-like protein EPR1 isoform X2 [Tribolium madens]|nr:proline-rich extensin-like protein EPR1 isoform X2 [Tribolium madens]
MSWWLLTCLLAVWFLTSTGEDRKIHRLVGGHLRIYHEDPSDAELLEALASGSKNKKSQKTDDEEKKTLSQQVADGKYGLIQKELFAKPSKRPGVLSYDSNPEVPKDNINNLGGLTKNEIWLAENHLLVLKGGTYPPHDDKTDNTATSWPPIDDYKAPRRQVKIPAHPKVPPPFPVQLTDDGPLQILGTNSSRTLNGTFDQTAFAVPPPEGFDPGPYLPPNHQYSSNSTSGQAPYPIPAFPPGEYLPGAPFLPYNLNGTLPPFFASLPPGAAILPPPNQTEPFDEDDPSIYYPPPYSFYYPKDNSSAVAAGPLVPGIILPPPPDFFGPLEETTKPTRHRMKTTTTPLPQIHPTTTAVPPTSVLKTRKPIKILPIHIPAEINNELKPIVTTSAPKIVTILPKNRTTQKTRPPTVTILKPVKPSSAPPKIYVYNNEFSGVYKPPSRSKTVISTTQVPLKVYYSTSNEIETNSITHAPERYHIGTRRVKTTTKSPTQYYYYQEQPKEVTTRKPFYDIPKEYYIPAKQVQQQKFIYVPTRPQRPRYRFVQTPKTDTFSIHIARLQKQIHQYYTTPRPTYNRPSPKPVYQFSFEASNYRPQRPQIENPQDKFRPLPKYSVQIQPAIEIIPTEAPTERPKYYSTAKPDYEYKENPKPPPTPRPISQFAFVTPNPVYQGFYTKPDEGFFDENTKQYFTTFGQKLTPGTTPLPPRRPPKPNLEGDTAVNFLPPRPTINPDAEFVPINPNQQRINYPQVVKYPRPIQYAQETRQKKHEIVKNQGQEGSFISYQLPGDDGAHFYFLTPQLAQSRAQGAGYYYSQPRIRRNKER